MPTPHPHAPDGVTLGLALGGGTGPELAAIFRRAVDVLAAAHGVRVAILASPTVYGTFTAALQSGASARAVAERAESEADHYAAFLGLAAAQGVRAVFRTAINAQSLYLVRERLLAVKLDRIAQEDGELLLVRDQTQGFYAGTNSDPDESETVVRTCTFSRERTGIVLDAALEAAAAAWGGRERIERIVMVCKFHLLDNRFATWVAEHARRTGTRIELLQPDTANRNLLRGNYRGRVLLIASNEWGDIMDAAMTTRTDAGSHDERFTRNVYLAPSVAGLVEYQTAHGSADDIAGRQLVNPAATLAAAAHLMQAHAGCAGAEAAMHAALDAARAEVGTTPDRGGNARTEDVVAAVLAHLARAGRTATVAPTAAAAAGEVLVVVDLQNEYCAPGGRFVREGLVDGAAAAALADRVDRLAQAAREAGVPVVFVRTLYDEARLPPVVAARHRAQGRAGSLADGSWEASAFGAGPAPGDGRLAKWSYDAFLSSTLPEWLAARGARRLLLAGVFTDVCVDALARSAFQHGFAVDVVRDGTLALAHAQTASLAFMQRFYAARIRSAGEVAAGWQARREPAGPSAPAGETAVAAPA